MKLLTINAKCSDMCFATLREVKMIGTKIYEHEGYAPNDLGIGGGDYIELTIDLETGQIQNWKPPTDEQLNEVFNERGS